MQRLIDARPRVRGGRRRLLRRALLPRVRRAVRAEARRGAAGRDGRRGQARPAGLHAVEGREARRAVVADAVGTRPAGLAPGVLGDGADLPRRRVRRPRRRARPGVPAPRERARAVARGRRRVRPVLDAQRHRRDGRREDVEVAGQRRVDPGDGAPGARRRSCGTTWWRRTTGRRSSTPTAALDESVRAYQRIESFVGKVGRADRLGRAAARWARSSPPRSTTTSARRPRSPRCTTTVRAGLHRAGHRRRRRRPVGGRHACARSWACSAWTRSPGRASSTVDTLGDGRARRAGRRAARRAPAGARRRGTSPRPTRSGTGCWPPGSPSRTPPTVHNGHLRTADVAGNSKRKGAIRKTGTKKGAVVGSGGQRPRAWRARARRRTRRRGRGTPRSAGRRAGAQAAAAPVEGQADRGAGGRAATRWSSACARRCRRPRCTCSWASTPTTG